MQSVLGRSSGPAYLDILTNTHDLQWNVRALRKAGLIDKTHSHFSLELLDKIVDAANTLGIADQVLPRHRRIVRSEVILRHGSYYATQAAANSMNKAHGVPLAKEQKSDDLTRDHWSLSISPQVVQALAQRNKKIHFKPDASDIQLMIEKLQNYSQSKLDYTTLVEQNGLIMLSGTPESFLAALIEKEQAYMTLRDSLLPQRSQVIFR